MKQQKTGTLLLSVYNSALKTFKKSPSILLPFIIFALLESASLALIYFLPRQPLIAIFGPPIRAFWGERFLHFPSNFLLYPKLLSLSKMGLTVLLGSLLTGMAVSLIISAYSNKRVRFGAAFATALKKYISLFIVVFVFTFVFYVLTKFTFISLVKYFRQGHEALLFIKMTTWLGPLLIVINFIMAIFIQAAFIYTIPILISETANPVKAIVRSFVLFGRLFVPTIILVGVPMLIYIPKIILDINSAFLMYKFFPEVVVLVSVLGIILSSLIMDPLITIATTVLYLVQKEE